tara:strand:- start:327 stop:506 length:180 start_codon:yes stop_codon:yes gene_type:complete
MTKTLTKVSLPIAPRNQDELQLIDKERAKLNLSRPDYLFARSRRLRQIDELKKQQVVFN